METQITIDLEACQGHGKCYLLAKQVYSPIPDNDWGQAQADPTALNDENDPDGTLRTKARVGANACPESAIELSD